MAQDSDSLAYCAHPGLTTDTLRSFVTLRPNEDDFHASLHRWHPLRHPRVTSKHRVINQKAIWMPWTRISTIRLQRRGGTTWPWPNRPLSDGLSQHWRQEHRYFSVPNETGPPSRTNIWRKTQHHTAAGILALIVIGTSPTSACLASMSLQGKTKTVALLTRFLNAKIPEEHLASLRYVPLDLDTLHIRMFLDGSFQNLPDKHSQIGFILFLADSNESSICSTGIVVAPRDDRPQRRRPNFLLSTSLSSECKIRVK